MDRLTTKALQTVFCTAGEINVNLSLDFILMDRLTTKA